MRKRRLLMLLLWAREELQRHNTAMARYYLSVWREEYAFVPASTRRRWRCGR